MLGKSKSVDSVTPGKMFEYFGTNKPILACVPEGIAKVAAQEYGASYITEPDDVEEIKNALIKIHNDYRDKKLIQPNEEYVTKHRKDIQTEQLTKLFQFYLRVI
jgi:glycosyltransferase involved in cell wall biosynthesis